MSSVIGHKAPKLTEKRRRVLEVLARVHDEGFFPKEGINARTIAEVCGEHSHASDWAHQPLREMAFHGLVEPVGVDIFHAKTWVITLDGLKMLRGQ